MIRWEFYWKFTFIFPLLWLILHNKLLENSSGLSEFLGYLWSQLNCARGEFKRELTCEQPSLRIFWTFLSTLVGTSHSFIKSNFFISVYFTGNLNSGIVSFFSFVFLFETNSTKVDCLNKIFFSIKSIEKSLRKLPRVLNLNPISCCPRQP